MGQTPESLKVANALEIVQEAQVCIICRHDMPGQHRAAGATVTQ